MRIYEQLVAARPDAFLPDLAGSLNNLAKFMSELGRREEALGKAQEAVRIYEQLAVAQPDAFLPDLAMLLNNLGMFLSDLGLRDEALGRAQEALRVYEQLAVVRPGAFLPYLAGALNNLANRLSDSGRQEEAVVRVQEAVQIYAGLAATQPEAFLPDLARSLGAKGQILIGLKRPAEAAEAFHGGIAALQRLFRKLPTPHAPTMALLCTGYHRAILACGAKPDEDLLNPIIEVFNHMRRESSAMPTGDGGGVADSDLRLEWEAGLQHGCGYASASDESTVGSRDAG